LDILKYGHHSLCAAVGVALVDFLQVLLNDHAVTDASLQILFLLVLLLQGLRLGLSVLADLSQSLAPLVVPDLEDDEGVEEELDAAAQLELEGLVLGMEGLTFSKK
jgi:hypothetical protein